MNSQPRPVRLVGADELRAAIQFTDLVEPAARALDESSAGRAANGLVVMFPAERPELGDVYVKTGTLRGHPVYIVKVSPWFASNVEDGQPQGGFIGVFDSRTGHTVAILDDEHYLSDIRTAAVGALAARALAPADVTTAAVLGAGGQAYWQPQALLRERPFQELVIWARNAGKATVLAARLRPVLPDVEIRIDLDLERTVRAADVLMTATSSREPLVRGAWLHNGQHITAVGADDATKRELGVSALRRARVVVDDLEANAANGDIGYAIQNCDYTTGELVGELGDVLAGRTPGRRSAGDITIAKLVGIGVVDLVAAEASLRKLGTLANAPALRDQSPPASPASPESGS